MKLDVMEQREPPGGAAAPSPLKEKLVEGENRPQGPFTRELLNVGGGKAAFLIKNRFI